MMVESSKIGVGDYKGGLSMAGIGDQPSFLCLQMWMSAARDDTNATTPPTASM